MAKKELKPSQIQAQIEAENAAALEALRKDGKRNTAKWSGPKAPTSRSARAGKTI